MLASGALRAVLAHRGFRRLLAVRLSSQFADGIFQAGIGGSVLFNPQQRTSPIEIAIGFAILLLPYSAIGPYVGVFLDRWSRRNILMLANIVRAVLILPLAALLWFGAAGAPFALLALIIIAINRFFLAGLSASLRHVADDPQLATANAFANTLGTVAFSTGLASAIGLLTIVGTGFHGYSLVVLSALLGCITSAILARFLFVQAALGPDEHDRPVNTVLDAVITAGRGMFAGAAHLYDRRRAFFALLAQGIARGFYGLLTIAMLLFAKTLDHGKEFVGLVFVFGAVGALIAALITPAATRRWGGPTWLLMLLAINAVAVPVLGFNFQPPLLIAAVFVLNVTSMGSKIVVDTALQHECDDHYQGRVFSVNDMAFNALYVVGLFAGAALLPIDGRSVQAVVVVAVGYCLLALWFSTTIKRAAAA